jgi:2-oxoglutarate dehydrogenase E1 component
LTDRDVCDFSPELLINLCNYRPMIPETDTDMVPDDKIRKLLLCSGKVYYELRQHRNTVLKDKSVAIVRVEQLHPFPWTQMAQTIAKYPNAEVCWVQEG